jgi:hypothetical protein
MRRKRDQGHFLSKGVNSSSVHCSAVKFVKYIKIDRKQSQANPICTDPALNTWKNIFWEKIGAGM